VVISSDNENLTLRQLLEFGSDSFRNAGFDEPKNEARWLISRLLDLDASEFYKNPERKIGPQSAELVLSGVRRRLLHEPAAYITGYAGFYGREFEIGPGVLIPRPDTEILVEHLLDLLRRKSGKVSLLDSCSGSGCIGITAALELTKAGRDVRLDLADISKSALGCMQKNIKAFGLEKIAGCHQVDLWPQSGKWDVITANPPYIESQVIAGLQPEVSVYEPQLALDGGSDGLLFYRRLAAEAVIRINKGGILVLEHGYNQAEAVKELLQSAGWHDILQLNDYGGNARVTSARFC
jgi:release factor glutamine methyltransferase